MFYGRKDELNALEKAYKTNQFQFPVIYGRRRVGKSSLIKQFIKGKPAIYYVATEQEDKAQLEAISEAVRIQHDDRLVGDFRNWEQFFSYVANEAHDNRLVLVIDEYPYLAKAYPAISSIIQKYIDGNYLESKLFLILCGSSMSFMEKQVLGYESPLYGRRTAQIKLLPMGYREAVLFFDGWSLEDKLYAYGICGGVPQYLDFFSRYDCLKSAVVGEFLETGGHLSEEPSNLLKQELREPSVYNSILTSIAHGRNRQIEISDSVGKSPNQIASYLNNLTALQIIEKILPVGVTNSKRAIYSVKDNLFRFYHFFIIDVASYLLVRTPGKVYDESIEPLMADYFGHIFEDICIEFLEYQMKCRKIRELYQERGCWRGTDPRSRQQQEIDIVFANKNKLLTGECKWKKEKTGLEVLFQLKERTEIIREDRNVRYFIFSRTGFEKKLVEEARKNKNVVLVGIEELVE